MTKITSLIPALAITALVSGFGSGAVAAATAHPTTPHSRQSTQGTHARHPVAHEHAQQAAPCGQYMYHHDGKCTDIRNEKGKSWMNSVF
ncbi:hypothetical protein [Hyphomicrobium sp. CS1BSMeth3]|mgnify:FL=1|uniref:hypothetical protein n=1 Tax=Hyphomicrobium sp. CS1BSMeth3 TaxID=1892844 RepID=UPI0009305DB4|nr:hypothetical protein [Hyphomicrobium sp. CS1BSMeth3]